MVVRRWSVFVRETAGARKVFLAASDERNGSSNAGTVIDVAGRDRLAASGAQLRAADGCVSKIILVFLSIFILL
jgi:hypothetical protein